MRARTLAKQEKDKPYALRFEAYLNGVEICNGYHELVDSVELQKRFAATKKLRQNVYTDSIFEETMAFGLPPSAGNALGIDRVIALLAQIENLSSLYPTPFLSQFQKGTIAED
jgi:lysyl-tRNA synthetase class 2